MKGRLMPGISMPPGRPLTIFAAIACLCALALAIEAGLLQSMRQRNEAQWLGFGAMLANFLAVALGARLYTIHADAVRMGGLRGDEPIALGGVLGIVLTAGTIYLTVITARVLARTHQRPVAGVAVLIVATIFVADIGAWIFANGVAFWIETAYLADPVRQGDGLGVIPLFEAIFTTVIGAFLLSPALVLVARLRLSVARAE
jgi:hypothetical protein